MILILPSYPLGCHLGMSCVYRLYKNFATGCDVISARYYDKIVIYVLKKIAEPVNVAINSVTFPEVLKKSSDSTSKVGQYTSYE
jgi:hypothetical protein